MEHTEKVNSWQGYYQKILMRQKNPARNAPEKGWHMVSGNVVSGSLWVSIFKASLIMQL